MKTDTEILPDDTATVGGIVAIVLGLVAMVLSLKSVLSPPYADAELANIVDTWEPSVLVGLFLLAVFVLGALASVVVAVCSTALPRKLFSCAFAVLVGAVVFEVVSLNMLTSRAEKASGQELHWSPLANKTMEPTR